MALLLEDGTGVANANTYQTTNTMVAYFVSIGQPLPTYTEAEMEAGLIDATNYLEFEFNYKGTITHSDSTLGVQPLLWPRSGLCTRQNLKLDSNSIPLEVIKAQAELARASMAKAVAGNRFAFSDTPERTGIVIKNKLDVMEQQFSDTQFQTLDTIHADVLDYVNTILRPYILGSSFQGTNTVSY